MQSRNDATETQKTINSNSTESPRSIWRTAHRVRLKEISISQKRKLCHLCFFVHEFITFVPTGKRTADIRWFNDLKSFFQMPELCSRGASGAFTYAISLWRHNRPFCCVSFLFCSFFSVSFHLFRATIVWAAPIKTDRDGNWISENLFLFSFLLFLCEFRFGTILSKIVCILCMPLQRPYANVCECDECLS